MLKTIRLFSVLSCLSLVSVVGCAVDGTQNDGASSTNEDLSKKYHYEPSVQGVAWNAGCGPVHPVGSTCNVPKIVLTYEKKYVDLSTTSSVRVDAQSMTITIGVDTWSSSTSHSHVQPMPEALDVAAPAGLVPGQTYTVQVNDYHGKPLFTGEIKVMLAA